MFERFCLRELGSWVLRSTSLLLLVSGCANFSVRPASGKDEKGLHFFLPKPYILTWFERNVTVKSGAVLETIVPHFEVVYLPDLSQRYTITQEAFLATGDFSYELADGWRLQSINGKVDTTELLRFLSKPTAQAVESAMARIQKVGGPKEKEEKVPLPPPRLYELLWDEQNSTYKFRPVELPGFTDFFVKSEKK